MAAQARHPQQPQLVILPESVVSSAASSPLLQGILPVAAGFSPEAKGHAVRRPNPLADGILIYCLSGHGTIQIGDGTPETVAANQVAFIPPQTPHAYHADGDSPWSIHWAHIRGYEVDAYLSSFEKQESAHVLTLSSNQLDPERFQEIHDTLESDYTLGSLLSASQAARSILIELYLGQSQVKRAHPNDPLESALSEMRHSLGRRLSLDHFAKKAGLSTAQFSANFRQKTGYPPIEFFLRLKIQKACRLLDSTNLRIEEIANRLGYEDAYYFSRLFRKIMGHSPRAYRNSPKG